MNARYKNPDNDYRGPWQSGDLVANEERANGYYDVFSPTTGKSFNVPKGKHWVYSQENMNQLIADNRIYFGKDGNAFPRKKRFLSEVMEGRKADTLWLSEEVGHNQEGKREIVSIFNDKNGFSTPKPIRLISKIIQIASDKDSLILDSFAGSGTTAHAVLNLNKTDGGNRRFILVELMPYADTITAERIKRVISGYGEDKKAVDGTGGDFSYYELGEPLLIDDNLNESVGIEKIREYIWYTETRQPYSSPESQTDYLGTYNFTAYYFHYEPDQVCVLDYDFLATIQEKADRYVVYADRCSLSDDELMKFGITFKKIPRDITRL